MFGKANKLLEQIKKLIYTTFFRYLIIGGVGYILELSVLIFCVHVLKVWYLYSNLFSSSISLIFTYSFNCLWTFSCRKISLRGIMFVLIFHFMNLSIFSTILYFLTSIIGVNYLLSKIIITFLSLIWNFFVSKKIIYK